MNKQLHKFLKSDGGNFAATFGLTLAPILMTVGMAVDYSAYSNMDNRAQIASDSAMLHAAKQMQLAREEDDASSSINYSIDDLNLILKNNFKPYYDANFDDPHKLLDDDEYSITFDEAKEQVVLDLDINYDTAVWQAFGKETMPVKIDMTVELKQEIENYVIDIVMCIDATGSMQETLDSVTASADTFNADLRAALPGGVTDGELKVRVKPIFYRDWDDQRNREYVIGALASSNIYKNYGWRSWGTDSSGTHKRVKYYYWYTSFMESWNYISNYFWGYEGYYARNYYVENDSTAMSDFTDAVAPGGLIEYPDFIDLNPNASTGLSKSGQASVLQTFLGSQVATGGWDWPEAAGACLNEGQRSAWYDNQSDEAREYFDVPSGDVIIADGDTPPTASYTKITPIPIVVFWTDAPINSLSLSRTWLSNTTPTTYTAFENQWNDSSLIDQNRKMMIMFGPNPSGEAGWSTVKNWDGFSYGGSLSTGNQNAANVIAEKIKEALSDVLQISS